MEKPENTNGQRKERSWKSTKDHEMISLGSENVSAENPKFPIRSEKGRAENAGFSDKNRKKAEIQNSTIGGF